MAGPTEIAVGAPEFSFRKHQDGGFIITQRGALDASLVPDHLLLGLRYLPQLRAQRDNLRISLGFSGHGFGTSPAAGQLAADLVSGCQPIIDPAPYRFERF